jgi:hypothetical protein
LKLHVEHQRAIGSGQTRDVMSTALDAQQEIMFTCKLHARDHVCNATTAYNKRGLSVYHGVPNGSGLIVSCIAGQEYLTLETHFQAVDRVQLYVDLATLQSFQCHSQFSFLLFALSPVLAAGTLTVGQT